MPAALPAFAGLSGLIFGSTFATIVGTILINVALGSLEYDRDGTRWIALGE